MYSIYTYTELRFETLIIIIIISNLQLFEHCLVFEYVDF